MGFRIEEEDAGIVVLELQIAWILQFVEEVEVHHAVILVFFFQDRKVILFVNGKLLDTHLIHSEEGYDDYRRMDISEVLVVGW